MNGAHVCFDRLSEWASVLWKDTMHKSQNSLQKPQKIIDVQMCRSSTWHILNKRGKKKILITLNSLHQSLNYRKDSIEKALRDQQKVLFECYLLSSFELYTLHTCFQFTGGRVPFSAACLSFYLPSLLWGFSHVFLYRFATSVTLFHV